MQQLLAVLLLLLPATIHCQERSPCTTPDRMSGQCVHVSDCPLIKGILMNAPTPLPDRVQQYIRDSACGRANGKTLLCCRSPEFTTPLTEGTPSSGGDISNHPNLNLLPTNCGPISTNKLSGGNKTNLGEFPWMALLRYETPDGLRPSCGGSIINKRYILTAAHCVTRLRSDTKFYSVLLGEHDKRTDPDTEDGLSAPPLVEMFHESIIPHPSYNRPRYANDIALIRLNRDITFTEDFIQPVCLPANRDLQTKALKSLVVAGWGKTEDNNPSDILLKALLDVTSIDDCRAAHRNVIFNDNQICAKGQGIIDSCKGDSGGPLFFPFPFGGTKFIQFGIVSAGAPGCGEGESKPGIYVKVQNYIDWILTNMKP